MSIQQEVEGEEDQLFNEYEAGDLSQKEYERELRRLYRDAGQAIREEAERAYDNVMDSY